jgi:hypothetical protein
MRCCACEQGIEISRLAGAISAALVGRDAATGAMTAANAAENNAFFVPLLIAAWAVVEAGLSAYDIADAAQTLADPNATREQKAIAVAGVALGMVAPGGGYGAGGKAIWSSTNKLSSVENALGHWNKHRADFPELNNAKEYVEATHKFVSNPPQGTLSLTRSNGEVVLYNPNSNTIAVRTADGTPKTMSSLIRQRINMQMAWSISMHNDDKIYRCRVCGIFNEEPPWGERGNLPTFNICECCGVEFGYEDSSIGGIRSYRKKWIESRYKWFSPKHKPSDWSPEEQMIHIPEEFR